MQQQSVTLGQSFLWGRLQATLSRGNRNRLYQFALQEAIVEGGATSVGVEPNPTPQQAGADSSLKPGLNVGANDHPEDRQHIAAHIALLVHRKCLAFSLPKKSGGSREDNPDMVLTNPLIFSDPYVA
jgi:hypothetical protein